MRLPFHQGLAWVSKKLVSPRFGVPPDLIRQPWANERDALLYRNRLYQTPSLAMTELSFRPQEIERDNNLQGHEME
jgi:hypothetical protein